VIDAQALDPETLLALSDERDAWLARLLAAERAAFLRGVTTGRQMEGAERDAEWNRIAGPIARGGPEFAELERRRWGAGGSEHFGDPGDGDYAPQERAA
jgi:hypothetical protein